MELKLLIVFIVFLLWTRHLTSAATPKICYAPMLCDGKPVWINLTKCSQEEIEVKFSNEITRLTGEVIYLQDQFAILEKARHDLKCTTQATVTAPSTSNHFEVLAKSKPAEQLMECLVPAHCEDGQDYLEMHIWSQNKGTSSCMTMYSDKVQIIQEMSADVVFLHNRLARMQKTLHALQTAKQATVETPSTSNTVEQTSTLVPHDVTTTDEATTSGATSPTNADSTPPQDHTTKQIEVGQTSAFIPHDVTTTDEVTTGGAISPTIVDSTPPQDHTTEQTEVVQTSAHIPYDVTTTDEAITRGAISPTFADSTPPPEQTTKQTEVGQTSALVPHDVTITDEATTTGATSPTFADSAPAQDHTTKQNEVDKTSTPVPHDVTTTDEATTSGATSLPSADSTPAQDHTTKQIEVDQTSTFPDTIRSNITCEQNEFSISCDRGKIISIIHANYGREDKTTCGGMPAGALRNTGCSKPNSMDIVGGECNNQTSCSFEVDNYKFGGDPCHGMYKYLNVSYKCVGP